MSKENFIIGQTFSKLSKMAMIAIASMFIVFVACNKPKNRIVQTQELEQLNITVINETPALPVNQQISGTCWAFSTASFLESEIYRTKGSFVQLSPMYFVYNAYLLKAQNYILRQGTARFSEGGCNYDPLVNIDIVGLLPQEAYSGIVYGNTDHRKMFTELTSRVTEFANPGNRLGGAWREEIPAILDKHLGKPTDVFSYKGTNYTSSDFWEYCGLKTEDYINITSFMHAPYDRFLILEIPANWSNSSYFNVSLDEYMENIDHALETGFSLAIDMDLSEPGLSVRQGFAVLQPDIVITPEKRQADFEDFSTTDDHNMHLVGKVKDQHGNIYYKCKNSWGKSFGLDGHYYLSLSFLKSKSIYVMLHKDGLTESTRKKYHELINN